MWIFSCLSCLGAAILINKPNNPPLWKKLRAFFIIQMHVYIYKEMHHVTFSKHIFLPQNSAEKTNKKNVATLHRLLLLAISRISTLSEMFNEIQGRMLNTSLQHCKFYILIWHNREMLHVSCLFTVRITNGILFEMHNSITSVIVSSLATRLASLKKNGGCTVSRHRKLQNIRILSLPSTKYLLVPIR